MNGCEKVISAFLDEPVTNIRIISEGHINKTFLAGGRNGYILQCLNPELYRDHVCELLDNYDKYRRACDEKSCAPHPWICPEWLTDRDGQRLHTDDKGDIWRMYRYIPSDDPNDKISPATVYEIGRGLGRLHAILKDCKGIRTVPTMAHLHDLKYHYDRYCGKRELKQNRIAELDRAIDRGIRDMMDVTVARDNIIHGDAKCSNMVFKDGIVVGFIDLDTLMEGSVFYDIADAARSCAVDEKGLCDRRKIGELLAGYEDGAKTSLEDGATALTVKHVARSRFILGIRYYTDYLFGEHYFAEDVPGRTLKRAKELLLTSA